MRSYESLCVLHPELSETRIKEVIAWMRQIVEGSGGRVGRVDEWGMRDLRYRIRKQRRGYYVRIEYEGEPAVLWELERNLKLSDDVLRALSVTRAAAAGASDEARGSQQAEATAQAPSPEGEGSVET